jgi:hypothetical protein
MDNQAKLSTIITNALKIIRNPVEFYQTMPKSGGLVDPMIFVLIMAVIMGLESAIFSLFGMGAVGAMTAGLGAIIILPVSAVIGSFIGAAILFVIWRLMGSSENYETAYRCTAYISAIYPITALIGLIPYVGIIVGVAWGMYLLVTASIEVHQLSSKTTYIVFCILAAILIVTNISAEIATRQMISDVEGLQKKFGKIGKQFQDSDEMTPEQAGKAMGDFFKALEQTAQKLNNQENSNIAEKQPEQPNADMTPEQAGQALGGFLKGLEEATKGLSEQNEPSSTSPNNR